MIRRRTGALFLTAMALLVIWYFVGGRQEILWQLAVHRAAQTGWGISHADRYPNYGLTYRIAFIGGLVALVTGIVNVAMDLSRKMRKARNDRASKAN
jgi:hypothetical protein